MEDFIAQLSTVGTKKVYKKRSIILYQGEIPRTAFILLSGAIKVYSISPAGEEQVVAFHTMHDIFPTPWLFKKSTTTLYYYETLSDCELLCLPREQLRKAMTKKPQYLEAMLDYYVTNYVSILMRVTALEQSKAREKIMFTLYYLLFRYGHEVRSGTFIIDLSLTHTVIASLVGLTRETTTTELSKLKRQKVLKYGAHTYTIDKQKFERLLGEDSFQDLAAN